MDYKEKYNAALRRAKKLYGEGTITECLGWVFPELAESDSERIRKAIKSGIRHLETQLGYDAVDGVDILDIYSWLEKQGEQTHVELAENEDDRNDVVKCLINGMKFYYEDNKEAMWGTEKFSMKVKDILNWLEKQGKKSVNIDIEPIISSYKQRLKSQGSIENTPLFDMCLTAFRHGVENVLEELNLKKLDPDKVIEWFRVNWWDSHIGNPIDKFKKDFGL